MKKPFILRVLFLVVLYALIFVFLVNLQFAKRNNFTHRVGNLVVQGYYAGQPDGEILLPNTYALDRGASVFFGGLEFDLGRNDVDGFAVTSPSGSVEKARADLLILGDNGVYFRLSGGTELSFTTRYSGGALELVMEADFLSGGSGGAGDLGLDIPFRPLGTSRMEETGLSLLVSSGGVNYTFGWGLDGPEGAPAARITGRRVRLTPERRTASYRAIPERKTVSPENFILAVSGYEAEMSLWRDKSYSAWNRIAGSQDSGRILSGDGETANAYLSEAIKRGAYRAAAAAVTPVYAPSPAVPLSFGAAAFAGKLDGALRSLSASERERYSRLARLFNERSPDFLKESHVVEFLGVRGLNNLLDDAVDMLRYFDPAVMTIEQSAGFFEGELDWAQSRPGRDNPYTRFTDQAFHVVVGSLKKDPAAGTVLAFTGKEADIELNLRLGSCLSRSADETRQALGKSIILSVLSFADDTGSAPAVIEQNDSGGFSEKPGGGRLSSSGMYRICRTENSNEYYARAQSLSSGETPGLWAWTAASRVSAVQQPGLTDITVHFPAGETHYMLIRGVRPFVTLQLYGINYPTDPQFERYDSSGWVYSAQEQTLLVKMKHRSSAEHIRIFYNAPPEAEARGE
ncbi:MAG: hypothetical protein LBI67_06375 [Treponema sp.]|nr:hypothetical protein [Treponema sp.]